MCVFCLVPSYCQAEDAVCIVWLLFFVKLKVLCVLSGFNVFVKLKMLCVYCLASRFCNTEDGSINTCTLLSPEDGFFLTWLPVLVMLKNGV